MESNICFPKKATMAIVAIILILIIASMLSKIDCMNTSEHFTNDSKKHVRFGFPEQVYTVLDYDSEITNETPVVNLSYMDMRRFPIAIDETTNWFNTQGLRNVSLGTNQGMAGCGCGIDGSI